MKLPFTEKFLWDLYKALEQMGELLDDIWLSPPKTMKEVACPDLRMLRRRYETYQKEKNKEKNRQRFAKLIHHLKRSGYLRVKKVKNKSGVIITPKGVKKILSIKIKLGEMKGRSDSKWQMVMFDIPEKRRKDRDWFRKDLRYLGYRELQKSIWICPYDILKPTQDLIKNYQLESFVKLLLVEEMEIS